MNGEPRTTQTTQTTVAVAAMPRGGPDASWLDQLLETDALEYTDRGDVPDELKQRVIAGLDAVGERFGRHRSNAQVALDVVSDVPHPRILELGSGHGKLAREILDLHPTAIVTASDLDPTSVANMSAGPLGSHPRARTRVVDATAIDAADDTYDLVVFALAFHHLPPELAYRAISEATRVGRRFLVIDLERSSLLGMILRPLLMGPMSLALMPASSIIPTMHDGLISSLRAYSRSAFVALGKAADPNMNVEFLAPTRAGFGPASLTAVFSRASAVSKSHHEKDSEES
jgi:SAM-dependent methyltransferase